MAVDEDNNSLGTRDSGLNSLLLVLLMLPGGASAAGTDDELCFHDDTPGGLDSIIDQVDQGHHRLGAESEDRLPNGGEFKIRH